MHIRRTTAALAGIGLVLSLSACSTSSDAAEETAADNAAYCQASATAQSEAAALKSLVTSDATLDQIQEQKDTLVDAVESAQEAAADLADSVRNQIEIADDEFNDAIEAIPSDATLSEAVQVYQSALAAWDVALLSIRADVGCS